MEKPEEAMVDADKALECNQLSTKVMVMILTLKGKIKCGTVKSGTAKITASTMLYQLLLYLLLSRQ